MPMAELQRLREIIASYGSAAVAYSGGADSAFLADVAHEVLRDRMVAVLAVSESLAPAEHDDARSLARERGWRYEEIRTRELERDGYRRNDADRCFHCKDELLDVLAPLAHDLGLQEVLLGANVDDLGDYRPGRRAAAEHGARTPLVEAGFAKADIRAASRVRGLPTWDKPAAPCLSSRIAYGIEVTPERLDRVAKGEAFLRSLGFRELRVRDHGDLARIEVPAGEISRLADARVRERVSAHLASLGFVYVTLDLQGMRSGSMNVPLGFPLRRNEAS